MKKVNIGILGYGTIGSSVDKLVKDNHDLIAQRTGLDLEVLNICDVSPKLKHPKLVRDAGKITRNPEISVVVESIGGTKPALDFILTAIENGKHVVTSNKEVMALFGDKIMAAAAKHGVAVLFEASVGGGIPIIGSLSSDLVANDVTEVYGIVNGTTNYILSKMEKEGSEFSDALKEAQSLGFAEANPKKDIEGYDASYKAAILASVAFRKIINWKDVYFEGITKITKEDISYAKDIGYVIKLLAIAKKTGNELEVRVHPTLIPIDHALASVNGPMNAIYVKGSAVGELMFYGQGAGGLPTASAVVSDIIAAVANDKCQMANVKLLKARIKNIEEISSRYYIRMITPDHPGVLAQISKAFADNNVSIAAVVQKENAVPAGRQVGYLATIVITTHESKDKDLNNALDKIKRSKIVKTVCNVLRII